MSSADKDAVANTVAVETVARKSLLRPNEKLDHAIANSQQNGLPAIEVSPLQGQFLAIQCQLIGAKTVLEIGTLGGYSTIWLAQAGAKVTSIEIDPKHRDVALQNVSGLDVEIILGAALDVLPKLAEEGRQFDMVFVDASWGEQEKYFDWAPTPAERPEMPEPQVNLTAAEILKHPAYKTTQWNLKPTESGFVEVAENRPGGPFSLWYEVHGNGPLKIVWIMGLGATRNMWKRQTKFFGHEHGDRYSCLVFDNRGVGKSTKPNTRYSTAEMARDVLELMKQIGWLDSDSPSYPQDINIVGISLGGMIAQELALIIPQRVQSLILIATAPRLVRTAPILDHTLQRVFMFLPSGLDSELDNKARRIFTDKFLRLADTGSLDPESSFPNNHDRFVAEELAEREGDTDVARRKGIILQAVAAGWHYKSPEDLAKMGDLIGRSRIMVQHGDLDETITFPHFEFFKTGFGEGPEFFVWDGCGHIPFEKPEDYHGVPVVTHGREVVYDAEDPNLPEISKWLSANPNRINLGRIMLAYKTQTLSNVTHPRQELNLWNGAVTSVFEVEGHGVKVITQGDFESDSVTFEIESELISSGDLTVEFDFPFPPIHKVEKSSDFEVFMGSYDMQETSYYLNLRWAQPKMSLTRKVPTGSNTTMAHRYVLSPDTRIKNGTASNKISLTTHFGIDLNTPDLPSDIQKRNSLGWQQYWEEGGFVDLTESSNPNATELQRRIILSQHAMRINSAATGQPPQESGLVYNGWWGKFHLEMVVWHCAHWVTWGRQKYFDNIFPAVYETLLPSSEERAKRMGWKGARWPKMTELVTKGIAPGQTRAFLQWQQSHPMYLAELAYKASPTNETLTRWDRVLTSTADYMASFAWLNNVTGKYDIGPPIQGVTENSSPTEISNLAYELAYWQWALKAACEWKQRLGQSCPAQWATVADNIAPPPQFDGLYAPWVGGGLNASWWDDPTLKKDPRSVIMLQGILPDTPIVDPEVGLATSNKVSEIWTDDQIRGWGRNILAINSARIGNPDRAIYHLSNFGYWTFGDQGFAHRSGPSPSPPPYFPGNGGFLLAISYMAAGWKGSEGHAPGFPKDGTWIVKHEGLIQSL
ncbi:hypothetical protein CkaCkLH20_11774 [Colletotrichum karsti]|uniref:AB hydrolase-1 domain-containing protein n=1 Tax=Colletotrichum karsti TaxID=1095194 RepID=A0A9P6HTI9_9PEZI|nr:uncharacterized protein CkaCkLH20_11774 [Colletotrichum karsti]KAF9870672.1 hypothetical protein CkaCkLH20_11774 [Colletotrichum karsti]